MRDEREPIWSVPKGTQQVFLLVFFLQILVALLLLPAGPWPKYIWHGLAPVILPAAALSLVFVEIGRSFMVLAEAWIEWRKKRERRRTAAVVGKVVEQIEQSARVSSEELDETLLRLKRRFECCECAGTGSVNGEPCLGCGGIGWFPTKAIIREG